MVQAHTKAVCSCTGHSTSRRLRQPAITSRRFKSQPCIAGRCAASRSADACASAVQVAGTVTASSRMAACNAWSTARSSCAKETVACSAVPLQRVSTSLAAKEVLGGGASIVAASTKYMGVHLSGGASHIDAASSCHNLSVLLCTSIS